MGIGEPASHAVDAGVDPPEVDRSEVDRSEVDPPEVDRSEVDPPEVDRSEVDPPEVDRSRVGPLPADLGYRLFPERRTDAGERPHTAVDKAAVRSAILRRRRARVRREPEALAADGVAVAAAVLGAPELARLSPGATVAAYLELPTELPVAVLRVGLHERGIRVIVPVLRADRELEWVRWLPESAGTGLDDRGDTGPADIADAAVIVAPGVAGDRSGNRLGRGGGSYDRAIGRLTAVDGDPAGTVQPRRPWICLVLFADELLAAVPVEPHDVRVDAVATPAGLHRVETGVVPRREAIA